MCDEIHRCFKKIPHVADRKLSLLLLDCWQREYDKRPYRNFKFDRLDFEQRLKRKYTANDDFPTIVLFLSKRSLCSAKLVGLRISSHRLELLHEFVESLKKLRYIELKLMNLPAEFFEILLNNVESMRVVNFSLEGTCLYENDILCLQKFVKHSTTLESLNLAACNINQYQFANIAEGIHKSQTLKSFNASRLLGGHLTLDSDKIAHIISSLIWQNKLLEITLEKCEFIAQDMEIIAEYLCNKCCKLQKLNMACNKIGPDGAKYLLKAIATGKTLKYLNLSSCGLGTHGGEIVAQYLSSCYHLESILLQYNNMTAEAVTMILLTMKKPHKLHQLYLYGNKYNPRTGYILKRLLDSRVVCQNVVDITVTFDDTIPGYRVIPWLT